MKMCRKLNVCLLVAIFFIIEACGSKLSNLRSLDDDSDDFEPELDSEYWGTVQKFYHDGGPFYRDADALNADALDADALDADVLDADALDADVLDADVLDADALDADARDADDIDNVDIRRADDIDVRDVDDEKWNEIDNLEWMNSVEDSNTDTEQLPSIEVVGNDNLEWMNSVEVSDSDTEQFPSIEVVGNIKRFTIGRRVHGDTKMQTTWRERKFRTRSDITECISYPMVGNVGRNLTYVTIEMNQTSNFTQARLTKGGVGKRFVTILVKAYKTLYFNYKATYYGK